MKDLYEDCCDCKKYKHCRNRPDRAVWVGFNCPRMIEARRKTPKYGEKHFPMGEPQIGRGG